MKWYNSIGMKIILSVVGVILIVNGALAYHFLSIQRENLNHAILRTASQLSETIKKSIQNDMLENRKEAAYKIMETIGQQEGIEKVRVYNSREGPFLQRQPRRDRPDGQQESGSLLRMSFEARPLERLATSERSRVFSSDQGEDTHGGTIAFSGSSIHVQRFELLLRDVPRPPEVAEGLGVIDVTMDLSEVDAQMTLARRQVLVVSVVSVAAIFIIVAFILFHFIQRPIKELVLGTKRISGGISTISSALRRTTRWDTWRHRSTR